MANEGFTTQLEFTKLQLIGSLGAVAETMRNCANMVDQFTQLIPHLTHVPGAPMPAHPNPQFVPVAIPQPVTGKRKTRDEVEGKKKKIIRDPNAPKRPASSYLLFQNDVRQSLKAKHPNVPNNELLQIISKLWQEMPKEQKDRYELLQKEQKEKWMKDKATYEHRDGVPVEPESPAAAVPTPEVKIVAAAAAVEDSTGSSSETDSSDDSDSSSSSSEEEVPAPPPKKSKKEKAVVESSAKGTTAPVKEKKSKKKA